jgi:hypothetical protein
MRIDKNSLLIKLAYFEGVSDCHARLEPFLHTASNADELRLIEALGEAMVDLMMKKEKAK